MSTRDGDTLTYDVENRLTSYNNGGVVTTYADNGDGARVKRSVANAGTTYYIGNYYEVYVPNSGATTFNKYYYFGSQRVAARIASTLFFFQGDRLGSSSIAMTQAGTSYYSRQTYFPYGAQRTTEGSALPTDYTFTGQKSDDSTGLMFYGARYYDTSLGRFIQADTMVPSPMNPQAFNRYSYVRNNPVNRIDPTGHDDCGQQSEDCDTYFHAQGLCWNAKREEYSKSCPATVDSEEDLEKIAHEHPEFLNNPNLKFLFGYDTQMVRVGILNRVGEYLVGQGETDLQVLVKVVQIEALMAPNGFAFIDDLSLAILGDHYYEMWRCVQDCPPMGRLGAVLNHGGSGFHPIYTDPDPNSHQVYHFFEYVATGFHLGYDATMAGVLAHEGQGIGNGGFSFQDIFLWITQIKAAVCGVQT